MMLKATQVIGCAVAVAACMLLITQAIAQDPGERNPPEDIPAAVTELQNRVDQLERQLKLAEKTMAVDAAELKEVEKKASDLEKRIEDIDRNKLTKIERQIDENAREIKELDRRVRRIE